jgi:hypothetical protein
VVGGKYATTATVALQAEYSTDCIHHTGVCMTTLPDDLVANNAMLIQRMPYDVSTAQNTSSYNDAMPVANALQN